MIINKPPRSYFIKTRIKGVVCTSAGLYCLLYVGDKYHGAPTDWGWFVAFVGFVIFLNGLACLFTDGNYYPTSGNWPDH